MIVAAALIVVPACKNMYNARQQVVSTGCSIVDGARDVCDNMLPRDWRQNPGVVIEKIADTSTRGKIRFSPQVVTKIRRTDIECRAITTGGERKIEVTYHYPEMMKDFPAGGTGDREFVVATFDYSNDEGCREARYGILDPPSAGGSDVYYMIIVKTAEVVPVNSGFDRRIGDWTMYRVYRKNGVTAVYDELRTGAYVQCGYWHDSRTYGDAAFTSCKDAHVPPPPPTRIGLLDQYFTIRSANASGVRKSSSAFDAISEEIDPAWGRCGALGCCASY